MIYKAAAYCRVSTSTDDQLNSFERQEQLYRNEINLHKDWQLYKLYFDKGLSGTEVINRPGFLSMKEAGLNHEYDILITREVSRLSRNIQHFYEFVRPLSKKGIWIIFLDDEIDSHMPDFETRAASLISHAQDESRKISQRVKRGQQLAMCNGTVFGTPPFGFDLQSNVFYENKDADTVRLIFNMYVNDEMSLRKISTTLNSTNIHSAQNKTWSVKTVRSILNNEKYCGILAQGKTKTIDYLTHERVKNDTPYLIENHHTPIIDKKTWDMAQMRLMQNSSHNTTKHTMSGKIKCSVCGKSFVARRRNNILTWKCSSVLNSHSCNNIYQLRDDCSIFMVSTALQCVILDKEYIKNTILKIIRKCLPRNEHDRLYNELQNMYKIQERILDDDLSGKYPSELIQKKLGEINLEITQLQSKIANSNNNISSYDDISKRIISLLEFNESEKTLLRDILENITVSPTHAKLKLYTLDEPFIFKLHHQTMHVQNHQG